MARGFYRVNKSSGCLCCGNKENLTKVSYNERGSVVEWLCPKHFEEAKATGKLKRIGEDKNA